MRRCSDLPAPRPSALCVLLPISLAFSDALVKVDSSSKPLLNGIGVEIVCLILGIDVKAFKTQVPILFKIVRVGPCI